MKPTNRRVIAPFVAYVASILLANVLTQYFGLIPIGLGFLVPAGTIAAGFALLARDFLQRGGGVIPVLAGIAVGIALSWFLASPALAVASCVAFSAAELIDLLMFTKAKDRHGFVKASALSNLVSAPLDTFVFLAIAGFPITWTTVGGQLFGKLFWATAAPLALYVAGRYTLGRRTATA